MGRLDNGFASEDDFQATAFQWVWNTFPEIRRLFFHPANERAILTKRDLIKAKQDEAKGMLRGVADFIFMYPSFAIELKQPGRKQLPEQVKFDDACKSKGVPCYVIEYLDDFKETVRRELAKVGVYEKEGT